MWFKLQGLHLYHFFFTNPLNFLASVLQVNNKLSSLSSSQDACCIFAIVTTILKRAWEARYNVVFNMFVDLDKILMLVKNDLKMELSQVSSLTLEQLVNQPRYWMPSSKGCLKLNVGTSYKDGSIVIPILAKDKLGKVQGLWFEKGSFFVTLVIITQIDKIQYAEVDYWSYNKNQNVYTEEIIRLIAFRL